MLKETHFSHYLSLLFAHFYVPHGSSDYATVLPNAEALEKTYPRMHVSKCMP